MHAPLRALLIVAIVAPGCRSADATPPSMTPSQMANARAGANTTAAPTDPGQSGIPASAPAASGSAGNPGAPQAIPTSAGRELGAMDCVDVRGELQDMGPMGYQNVVFLKNQCDETIDCDVSTTVDSSLHRVRLGFNGDAEVITRAGGQRTEFEPRVNCWYPD